MTTLQLARQIANAARASSEDAAAVADQADDIKAHYVKLFKV